jgi:predicted nucleic acid-binding protein
MAAFIDSDVLIDLLREKRDAVARVSAALAAGETLAMPAIVLFEVGNDESDKSTLEEITKRIAVAPFGLAEARKGSEIYLRLKAKGQPVGLGDVMIAATALASSGGNTATLLSNNRRDFGRIDGIRLA